MATGSRVNGYPEISPSNPAKRLSTKRKRSYVLPSGPAEPEEPVMSSAVMPIVRVAILDGEADGVGDGNAGSAGPVRLSLAPIGGAPFSLDASLDTVGVVDGDLLALQPVPAGTAAPGIVEDIADAAVIFSASRLKPWGIAHIQRGALAAVVGIVWAATGLAATHRVLTGAPAGLFAVGALAG